ncbi:MAG: hypothetical protein ABSG38_06215 [Spirochaetia bacterium]|jgi:hypothetical protein
MKRLIVLLFLFLAAMGVPAQDLGYHLSSYRASFELIEGSPDVRVTLWITYSIGNITKSDGFKYVGDGQVADLRCTDEKGDVLASRVASQKGTRLDWLFPATSQGDRKVRVQFRLLDYLRSIEGFVFFDADWAGVFRVPVENAVYELIVPGSEKPTLGSVQPSSYFILPSDRGWVVTAAQVAVRETRFSVRFKSAAFPVAPLTSMESLYRRDRNIFIFIGVAAAGLLGGVILIGIRRANSPEGLADTGGGGCGGGGCGGGGCGG